MSDDPEWTPNWGGWGAVLMLAPWVWGKQQKTKNNKLAPKMDVVEALHTDLLH